MKETTTKVEMFVERIVATCSSAEAKVERKMTLVDWASAHRYSSEYSMTLPAIEGVGTGDIIEIQITQLWDAVTAEGIREARLESPDEEASDD